ANDNVATALVGASRPEQVESNVAASGVKLDAEVLARIDEALGDLPETNPSKTKSPATRLV
ncbi:MAG: aldo/keto reductase, partial [Brevibacterium aurantiacum]